MERVLWDFFPRRRDDLLSRSTSVIVFIFVLSFACFCLLL
ncbi:hypothetical protein GVAMD_0896 [Gardnerella vaginalis AMD]|nr:hypothetical protein GVAMD_0896 [Gardnerella vaginalis AMD]